MTPTMSIDAQDSIKSEINDYAKGISMGFIPKENIPNIISKYVVKVTEELKSSCNTKLAKKYATMLVNSYAQRIILEINS